MILLYEERKDQQRLNMEVSHSLPDLPINQADHHKEATNNIDHSTNRPFLKANLIFNNKNQHSSITTNQQLHRHLCM